MNWFILNVFVPNGFMLVTRLTPTRFVLIEVNPNGFIPNDFIPNMFISNEIITECV